MTANGMAGSTEEATVHINDLDVFCHHVMLLEDSPAVRFLGLLCKEVGYSDEWRKGVSPSLI